MKVCLASTVPFVSWLISCLDFSSGFSHIALLSHPHYPFADPARVLNMPPVIYVPVGIHGYIRCPVDAEPPATVVKWNKDGRPLQVEKVRVRCLLAFRMTSALLILLLALGSGLLPGLLHPFKKKKKRKSPTEVWLFSQGT